MSGAALSAAGAACQTAGVVSAAASAMNMLSMLRSGGDRARWLATGAFVAGAGGFAVQSPALYRRVDRATGIANVSTLFGFTLFVICAGFLRLWTNTWPGAHTPAGARRTVRTHTIAAVALATLFLAADHHTEYAGQFLLAAAYPGSALFIGVQQVFVGTFWALGATRCRRARRMLEGPCWQLHGLAALETGLYLGLGFAAYIVGVLGFIATGGTISATWVMAGRLLSLTSVVLCCVGLTCGVWGPPLEALLEPFWCAVVPYRKLLHLWRLLAGHDDLSPAPGGLLLPLAELARETDYLLVRIWDGIASLSGYLDADLADDTLAKAAAAGIGEREALDQMAAAVLSAALRSKHDAHHPQRLYPASALTEQMLDVDRALAAVALIVRRRRPTVPRPRRRAAALVPRPRAMPARRHTVSGRRDDV
jgi:hypothetical protein